MKMVREYEVGDTGTYQDEKVKIVSTDWDDPGMELYLKRIDSDYGPFWGDKKDFVLDEPVAPELSPQDMAELGIEPGWQNRQLRQTALHHAVDFCKGTATKGSGVVEVAKAFEEFLKG